MKESNDTRDITFDLIYDKYSRLMMEIALRVLKNIDMAEDAFQDTLFAISQNIDKITDISDKTRNYIINIARNSAISIYRSNRKRNQCQISLDAYEDDDTDENGKKCKELSVESFENELFAEYDRLNVLKALDKLDSKYKIYIDDHFYKGLTCKQIAEKHGITEQAAWKRIYRSVAKLKDIFFEKRDM